MTQNTSLRSLEHHDAFIERHIGPNDGEIAQMLRVVGHDSLEAMTDAIVPGSIRSTDPLALPEAVSEVEALAKIRDIADRNLVFRSFIGQGYAGTHTPNVILRNILENPAWYTAYTPYQAEISQGRMEALINFQTMCADLTGMEIANASLLDEGTAAAEAMTLAKRSAKSKSNVFFVSNGVHPQTIEVLRTRAEPIGIELVFGDEAEAATTESFGVLLQYPDTFGRIGADYQAISDAVHARQGLVCGCTPFETKNTSDLDLHERLARVIASAAAVASSNNDELAISMPVRSAHMVWKLISASMRPCEISAWYGV